MGSHERKGCVIGADVDTSHSMTLPTPATAPPLTKGAPTACLILVLDERGLVPVFGVPAVRRLVLLARRVGLEPLCLLGRVESVRATVSDLLSPLAFLPVEDCRGLEQAVRGLALPGDAKVLVMKANHVIDQSLADLVATPLGRGQFYRSGGGEEIGDSLYLSGADELLPLLSALCFDSPSTPSVLSRAERLEGVSGLACAIGPGEKEARRCEARLIASLASAVRADDSFLSRHVNRRISRFASARVVRSRITANQITLINGIIGMAGGFFFALPGYWARVLGALLFLFCVIMDGADGEIARLKLQESSFGQMLDYTVDNVVHVAIFTGMAVGLYRDTGHGRYLLALSILLAGFGLCALVVNRYILKRTTDELNQSPLVIRLMATLLTNRDFAYLVLAFSVVDRLNWFLWGTTFGTYLFAATLSFAAFSERRTQKTRGAPHAI